MSPPASSSPPTDAEWLALYRAAVVFRDAAPWKWMDSARPFSVVDPESGVVGYCAVYGSRGAHYGLLVFPGGFGIQSYASLVNNYGDHKPLFGREDTILATFEDPSALEKDEVAVMRRLGLEFKSANACPRFTRNEPGCIWRRVTGAEARTLTHALTQSLEVARRIQVDPEWITDPLRRVLTRVAVPDKTGALVWKDEVRDPEPPSAPPPLPVLEKSFIDRLWLLPRARGAWELEARYVPAFVGTHGPTRFFAFLTVAVDAESGVIVGVEVSGGGHPRVMTFENFHDLCVRAQSIPSVVRVSTIEAYEALEPLGKALEFGIESADVLPRAREATEHIERMMERNSGMRVEQLRARRARKPAPRRERALATGSGALGARSTVAGGSAPAESWHLVRVALLDVSPEVWRRVLVPSGMSLRELHEVLQIAMGWENDHLHRFLAAGSAARGRSARAREVEIAEARMTVAGALPRRGASIVYEYDFGDLWRHRVTAERILGEEERKPAAPKCIDGARACPPEDCGGPWGYEELLEAIADPKHERHDEVVEWLAGDFDPERFDAKRVSARLAKARIRARARKRDRGSDELEP